MPRYIMKLHDPETEVDFYFEWSTIVDAPITYGMTLPLFKAHWKARYGWDSMEELRERLKMVDARGISSPLPFNDIDEILDGNQAGPDQSEATKKYILENYCKNWNA